MTQIGHYAGGHILLYKTLVFWIRCRQQKSNNAALNIKEKGSFCIVVFFMLSR